MALFITSVDKALAEKGLGFVSTIIDIALILLATFLVAFLLIACGVVCLRDRR